MCSVLTVFEAHRHRQAGAVEVTRKGLKPSPRVVECFAASEGDVVQAVGGAVRLKIHACHRRDPPGSIWEAVGECAVFRQHIDAAMTGTETV